MGLFKQLKPKALHRSQLIHNQYLLKRAMADEVMQGGILLDIVTSDTAA